MTGPLGIVVPLYRWGCACFWSCTGTRACGALCILHLSMPSVRPLDVIRTVYCMANVVGGSFPAVIQRFTCFFVLGGYGGLSICGS